MDNKELIDEHRDAEHYAWGSKLFGLVFGLTGAGLGIQAVALSHSGDTREALFKVGAASAYALIAYVFNELGKPYQEDMKSLEHQIQALSSSEL